MAKKEAFDPIKWERRQQRRLNARGKAIKELFDDLAQRASLLGIDVKLPSNKDFEFKNYPALEKRVDELVKEVSLKVTRIIEDGEEEAWIEANAKNDALVDSVVKGTGLPKEVVAQWKQPNLSALAAFQARKIAGMGLSQRVWKLTQTAKQELELALDLGIGEGKSAAELSRDIRRYLNEPNKLFRRVRDEKGILRLSKAAKMYHPGRGVYRSSYKNALRLTQTEINMAYRSSDHERWSQTDWIIGVRVSLSNNHTLNGLPFHDICDDVQGVYPKDFKFVGWHPKCRCHATPELAKREERIAYLKKMANGEDVSDFKFSGQTREVPQGFKDWVDKNAERIKGAEERGKLPYFLRDNGKFLTHDKEGLMSVAPQVKTPLEIAAERHAMRTPEQAKAIQDRWDAKRAQDNLTKKTANNVLNVAKEYPEVDIATLQQYIDTRNLKAMKEEARNVAKQVSVIKKDERFLEQLIPNVHEWKKQFTSDELHVVYDAVEKTFARWRWDDDIPSLNFLKGKLETEISFIESRKKYATWKVAQDAYKKRLSLVEFKIERAQLADNISEALTFAKTSKAKAVKNILNEWDELIKTNAPIAELKKVANKLERKYEDWVEKQLAKKVAVTGDIVADVDNFINSPIGKKYGLTSEDLAITKDNIVKLSDTGYLALSEYHKTTRKELLHSRKYVRTSNSFALNGKLDDVGGKGKNASTRNHINPLGTDRYGSKMTMTDITDIKNFDAVIAAREMPFDVELVRMVDTGGLATQFGVSGLSGQQLKDALDGMIGKTVTASRYLSFSTDIRRNVFTSRNVKWHSVGKKGTKCYFADNRHESEVVFGRCMQLTLKKVTYDARLGRFEIWVDLVEEA